MTAPQRPQPTPDQLPGRVNTHELAAAKRRMIGWVAVFAGLGALYAYLVFLRMKETAERLPGWPRGFPTGAALLFTGLSLFALGLLVIWATRPSRLNEALKSTGAITADTHAKIASLAQSAEGFSENSRTLADAAGDELDNGTRWRDNGKEAVIRVAQKAAVLAGVKRLVVPDATNLGAFHQDERDHAHRYLQSAADARGKASELLDDSPDFVVDTKLANPWAIRTEDRSAAPNPDYVDPSRLSTSRKGGLSTAWKVLIAVAVLALLAAAVFAATRASASTPSSRPAPAPSTTATPTRPPAPSAGTSTVAPPAADTYAYLDEVGGKPVRWSCDSPITVRLNDPPSGAARLLSKVVGNLKSASKLPVTIGNTTTGRSATSITPGAITVSYLSHAGFDQATGGASSSDAVGETQTQYDNTGRITGAWVVIDADDPASSTTAPDGYTVLAHELGHAVGLGHAQAPHEVMDPVVNGMTSWGVGDRYALKTVGCA